MNIRVETSEVVARTGIFGTVAVVLDGVERGVVGKLAEMMSDRRIHSVAFNCADYRPSELSIFFLATEDEMNQAKKEEVKDGDVDS